MGKFTFEIGGSFEAVTPEDLKKVLAERDAEQRARWTGKKYWRLPPVSGYAVAGVLDIGGDVVASEVAELRVYGAAGWASAAALIEDPDALAAAARERSRRANTSRPSVRRARANRRARGRP